MAWFLHIVWDWVCSHYLSLCRVWVNTCKDIMCQRYLTSLWAKWPIMSFSIRPAFCSAWKDIHQLSICPFKNLLNTTMLSRYIRHSFSVSPARTHSITLWTIAGALVRPDGITLNSKLLLGVPKVVYSLSCTLTSTCQQPEARSKVTK